MLWRVERRGDSGDHVVLLGGDHIWRGKSADDDSLAEATQKAVATHFLATLQDTPTQAATTGTEGDRT
jgi:hypothetical protein